MGRVVLAEDVELGRMVAIKIMSAHIRQNEAAFARFRREARIQARVEHPHVIKLYDWDLEAPTPYLVMEVVEGQDLDGYLRTHGPLDGPALLRLAREVGSGLDALHREGILHRDMKPANIMLREDGSAVVMDLGLAKAADVTALTQTGAMVGTPRFMPPEAALGARGWDARSDQFQLGAILFQAATGEHYIPGETMQELGQALQTGRFRAFPPRDPPLPEAVRAAILRAGAFAPERRFESCGAIAEAMASQPGRETLQLLAEVEAEPDETLVSRALGARPAANRGRSAAVSLGALISAGLGLGWVTAPPASEAPPPEAPPAAAEGPFGPSALAAARDEVAALSRLRLVDGRVGTTGGSPLFAVRPDPALVVQVLPHLPTAQRFHAYVARGEPVEVIPAATLAGLRELDEDLRGRGLPRVFYPATRGPPAPGSYPVPVDAEWFRWGAGPVPPRLEGWAGQAVRDYAAATARVWAMRRDLDLWSEERPSAFPDADLQAVNLPAATFRAKRFSRETLRLVEVADFCEDGRGRQILQPWYRDLHEHLRGMVWSLGQVSRHQPDELLRLARAWSAWEAHLPTAWTSFAWSLPLEVHLGGPLETPGRRLLGFELLVAMAKMNFRLGFRDGLVEEAMDLFARAIQEHPPGSDASGLLMALVTKLVCRQVPAVARLPGILQAYGEHLRAAAPHDRLAVAYELARVLQFQYHQDQLPPGYADRVADRLEGMLARLREEGLGADPDSPHHATLGHVANELARYRRAQEAG